MSKPAWLQPGTSALDIARRDVELALRRYKNSLFDMATVIEGLTAIQLRAGIRTGMHSTAIGLADLHNAASETAASFEILRMRQENLVYMVLQRSGRDPEPPTPPTPPTKES